MKIEWIGHRSIKYQGTRYTAYEDGICLSVTRSSNYTWCFTAQYAPTGEELEVSKSYPTARAARAAAQAWLEAREAK